MSMHTYIQLYKSKVHSYVVHANKIILISHKETFVHMHVAIVYNIVLYISEQF